MKDLLRFKKDQKYLLWDKETASLNLLNSANPLNLPWQLGWQVYEGNKLIESHEDWIWWDDLIEKMGKGAAELTGFDEETYKRKAKDPLPIFENFTKYLYDPSVINVGANIINFDNYIFDIFARRVGKAAENSWDWVKRSYDIQVVEKGIFLKQEFPPIGTDEWLFNCYKLSGFHQKGLKVSLAHLCKVYGVEYNEMRHHREALFDVEMTYSILQKQLFKVDLISQT